MTGSASCASRDAQRRRPERGDAAPAARIHARVTTAATAATIGRVRAMHARTAGATPSAARQPPAQERAGALYTSDSKAAKV